MKKTKFLIISIMSFAIGGWFIYLTIKMISTYGYAIFEYENTSLFPGNLRGLKFREFLWTLFAGLACLGNGWWHTILYRSRNIKTAPKKEILKFKNQPHNKIR